MQGHKELLLLIKLFNTFINDAIVWQDHPYITNFTASTLYPPLFLGPGLFPDRAIAKKKKNESALSFDKIKKDRLTLILNTLLSLLYLRG